MLNYFVSLPCLKILGEDENSIRVNYGGDERVLPKDGGTCTFSLEKLITPERAKELIEEALEETGMLIRVPIVETVQVRLSQLYIDPKVKKLFREVMIFHDIREEEYDNAGFLDACERATNDEYVFLEIVASRASKRGYWGFRTRKCENGWGREGHEVVLDLDGTFSVLFINDSYSIGPKFYEGGEYGSFERIIREWFSPLKVTLLCDRGAAQMDEYTAEEFVEYAQSWAEEGCYKRVVVYSQDSGVLSALKKTDVLVPMPLSEICCEDGFPAHICKTYARLWLESKGMHQNL